MRRLFCGVLLGMILLPSFGCGDGASAVPGTVIIDSANNTKKTKAMKPPPPVKPK